VPLFVVATIFLGITAVGGTSGALAAPAPAPSASPSPAPSAKPPSRFDMKMETYTSGLNQQFVGPGIAPPEGPGFATGSALAPGTPYDFFSGAPQVTGQGITQDFLLKPIFSVTSKLDLTATVGYASAAGTGNVINYYGDALVPTINPSLGSRAFTLVPAFPTHNGQDAVSASRMSVITGSILDHDGNAALNLGWFNLHQNLPFAFSQAPWTNMAFANVPLIPQSIGDGQPSIDVLKEGAETLPLQGEDAWVKSNLATVEIANASLPGPSTSPARLLTGSVVVDHGAGLRYSGELSTLNTTGPDTGSVLFGSNATLVNGVPQSTVYSQHMTVLGLGAAFPFSTSDAEARYAYSCYSATGTVLTTARCTSGNYYYGKVHHGFAHFDLAVEGVRFEGSYAPAILDYGTLQNVWTYPAAWPGTWLRGDYQFVDNSEVGPNRQGGRISTTFIVSGVEVRFAFAQYQQIAALNSVTAYSPGFVEPYFLPQSTAPGTLGSEQHFETWFNYHASFADLTLDLSQVNAWRQAPAGQPQDNVQMSYPAGVFSLSRPFGPKVTGTAGTGRYEVQGSFDSVGPSNASLIQNVIFAGVQLRSNANTGYGLVWSLYSTSGQPTLPGGPSPAYHGPQIQFYQRLRS
jgi:hypothetical protein